MLAFTYQWIHDKINLIKHHKEVVMKKAILMMTFGSPEEITFEGVADFFTNIRRGVRLKTMRFKLSMIIMYELEARLCKELRVKRLPW